METYSPLLLSTDTVTLIGDGTEGVFNPQQLMNPNREAMLIDEIRFAIGSSVSTICREVMSTLANITFGNSQLTNQSIPLLSFCPTYISAANQKMVTWHFPRPLYVPPTSPIGIKIRRKNPFPTSWSSVGTTKFGVALAGRSLPFDAPVPDKIAVPWACATSCYSSTWDATLNETPPFTSKDNEICNPFDADLQMSYLTGVQSTSDAPNPGPLPSPAGVNVRATYGSGKMFIRDPVPWIGLFPLDRPVLRTRGVMKPKDFLKVMLSIDNPWALYAGAAIARYNQINFATVGLVGYRMMETPR